MSLRLIHRHPWSLRLELAPRHLLVGACWKTEHEVYLRGIRRRTTLYLCLPCLALVLSWTWGSIRTQGPRYVRPNGRPGG